MRKPQTSKKIATKISLASEKRILELSLENPDFGARRLMTVELGTNLQRTAAVTDALRAGT